MQASTARSRLAIQLESANHVGKNALLFFHCRIIILSGDLVP